MKKNNLIFLNKALFFPKEETLVISDLHMGYEQHLIERGFLIPKTQLEKTKQELEEITLKIKKNRKLKEIIVLGDLKHEFGKISDQEWEETLSIIDFLLKNTEKLILIKGNHDTILTPILKKRNLEIKDSYIKGDICFFHGHKLFNECFNKKIKTWVIGHKHPAITISKEAKSETYKCFLKGKNQNKNLIILPSFFPLIEGTDISIEDNILAIKPRLNNFEVYVIADKVYNFKKLKNIDGTIN